MRKHLRPVLLAVLLAFGPAAVPGVMPVAPAHAVEPDEILADPALEARARELSAGLRCLVCQNQSIDDSNADLARDLRVLVRQRLVAGDTDEEVIDYLVSRYGEFVLLRPRFDWGTALLWGAPVGLLVAGGAFALLASRRRSQVPAAGRLSMAEEEAVREALRRRGL